MSSFSKVIPGRVENEGIVSRENNPVANAIISSPAHCPDFAMVTPRGPLKRDIVGTGDFSTKFGDVTDPYGPYYNPISLAISKLGAAGQASFSFKRLTNNEERARVIFGVTVFKGLPVPNYLRDGQGNYQFDTAGKPKPNTDTPTVNGIFICPGMVTPKSDSPIGEAKIIDVVAPAGLTVPEATEGKFIPLFELLSGVGDSYNAMYSTMGHSQNTDWGELSKFVRTFGSYPFTMIIGEQLDNGIRVPAATSNGTPDVTVTLFETIGDNNVHYGLQSGLNRFTGREVNRPVVERAAPFQDVFVYRRNLETVTEDLYQAEYVAEAALGTAPIVLSKKLPRGAVMNPLSLVDYNGKPYYHIVFGGLLDITGPVTIKGTRVSLNHYLKAGGGVNPYADKTGAYPQAPSTWDVDTDGEWVANVTSPAVVSHKQYWEMNQYLLLGYMTGYRSSLDMKDVIRNRTSFYWDLGYNEDIKDALISFLNVRKDIIVGLCATEYLVNKTQEQIYSTAEMLNTKLLMIPESETYQAQACRGFINLWDGRVVDEVTFGRFSLNIDNMYTFAYAGGGNDGKIFANRMPDHEGNRTLRIMHDPLVQFEDDDPAANNLIKGSVTVTPQNSSQYCRPAFPSVYPDTDSVLKEVTNVWRAVCVEKILADNWIQISGDSQRSKEGYISFMKDTSEARIRERLGAVISNWEVEPTFRENAPNAKSVMYSVTRLWMNKGVYMMNSVLEAYNADSLESQ
ncbi:putative tail sheath protein [Aeromonas phage AerS_266]|nr:putative tail sheath protein [Aeromonas phage AerS_266]